MFKTIITRPKMNGQGLTTLISRIGSGFWSRFVLRSGKMKLRVGVATKFRVIIVVSANLPMFETP